MMMREWFRTTLLGKAYDKAPRSYYIGWLLALALMAFTILMSLWGLNGALVGVLAIPAMVGIVFMLGWTTFF